MKHSNTILIAMMSSLLTGCHSPEVAFNDMSPTPTASVSGSTLTVHIGVDTNIPSSEVWVRPKAKVDGQTVLVTGSLSFYREQSREFVFRLPASVSSQSVGVVWVDPDGSRVPVPITK